MCGIFGAVNNGSIPSKLYYNLIKALIRSNLPAQYMIKDKQFAKIGAEIQQNKNIAVIGHTRLVTNGNAQFDLNNQPIVHKGIVLVHNGIICNHLNIWKEINGKPSADLDSEVIAGFVAEKIKNGAKPEDALSQFFDKCEGTASVAMLFAEYNYLLIGSNNCSLYLCKGTAGEIIFASEKVILEKAIVKSGIQDVFSLDNIFRLEPKEIILAEISQAQKAEIITPAVAVQEASNLKRCSKCILPETFPNIKFNKHGVCSICNSYEPINLKGLDALKALCDKHRRSDGKPDCIVAFSGGRDSSYAVHYMKNVMGMNPITYTYDWGMVTDLARRNIARICGKLGTENIIVSADIKKKRNYIKKNLEAWLADPELGMVTLLMAGDKEYFYHVKRLQKEFDIELVVYASSQLERSSFKSAFCGVNESNNWFFNVSKMQKFKMLYYFAKQYLKNPRYINSSIFDTLFAFYCAYIQPHTFFSIFDYIPWNEDEIMSTLRKEYDWEVEEHSDVTWRIGDGTAALYNYIYHSMAGFTENDTFRSNQIRNGMVEREEALAMALNDNKPRFEAIRSYAALIGVDFDTIISEITKHQKYK